MHGIFSFFQMKTSDHSILPLQFYVAESCLEVFARHMLFLALLFEPTDKLGLQGVFVAYKFTA